MCHRYCILMQFHVHFLLYFCLQKIPIFEVSLLVRIAYSLLNWTPSKHRAQVTFCYTVHKKVLLVIHHVLATVCYQDEPLLFTTTRSACTVCNRYQCDYRKWSFHSLTRSPYIYVGFYFERKLRFLLAFVVNRIWSVLFSSLYDELCWWYLFQTQYAVSTMIPFHTYHVIGSKSVHTVYCRVQNVNDIQSEQRQRLPWQKFSDKHTNLLLCTVKYTSTKGLELCACSIPQL